MQAKALDKPLLFTLRELVCGVKRILMWLVF